MEWWLTPVILAVKLRQEDREANLNYKVSPCHKTKKAKLIFEMNQYVYIIEEKFHLLLAFRTVRLNEDFKISVKRPGLVLWRPTRSV